MKRSEINRAVVHSIALLSENNIRLPFFGYLTLDEWKKYAASHDMSRINELMLGWDVTDFGSGDFAHCGCVLFTSRNGTLAGGGTPFAEKYLLFSDKNEQEIPFHFHTTKTEDIINRAHGIMRVQLYNSLPDDSIDYSSDVVFYTDGVRNVEAAGFTARIEVGCSISLTPRLYHRIYAEPNAGELICGEVSKVNDDRIDNTFAKKTARFCGIDEDEAVLYPLCSDVRP